MTIAFFSNFLNHHQKIVADELYLICDGKYTFVETTPIPQKMIEAGYPDYSNVPYLLKSWESDENMEKARLLAKTVDIAVFDGPEVLDFEILRANNTSKPSFDVSERWLKRGISNILSPRLLRFLWYYHTLLRFKPVYKLCASAYCANDMHLLRAFNNRCYKWGYFTKVDDFNPDSTIEDKFRSSLKIMWCARFIDWKHPEIPIYLAKRLKDEQIHCTIDMYGSGPELEKTKILIEKLNVKDIVSLRGNLPNDAIRSKMKEADVFLFTSDRNEGWGAVANEAMSNACVIIASDKIGSSPYLIIDKQNGRIFPSEDKKALFSIVKELAESPDDARRMALNAYTTIQSTWSPQVAAKNFIQLSRHIIDNDVPAPEAGPGSIALPI